MEALKYVTDHAAFLREVMGEQHFSLLEIMCRTRCVALSAHLRAGLHVFGGVMREHLANYVAESVADNVPLNDPTDIMQLPDVDDCPDSKIDEWLGVIHIDLGVLEKLRLQHVSAKDMAKDMETFRVIKRYRRAETRLLKRKKACAQ